MTAVALVQRNSWGGVPESTLRVSPVATSTIVVETVEGSDFGVDAQAGEYRYKRSRVETYRPGNREVPRGAGREVFEARNGAVRCRRVDQQVTRRCPYRCVRDLVAVRDLTRRPGHEVAEETPRLTTELGVCDVTAARRPSRSVAGVAAAAIDETRVQPPRRTGLQVDRPHVVEPHAIARGAHLDLTVLHRVGHLTSVRGDRAATHAAVRTSSDFGCSIHVSAEVARHGRAGRGGAVEVETKELARVDQDIVALERGGVRLLLRVLVQRLHGAGPHVDELDGGCDLDAARQRSRGGRRRGRGGRCYSEGRGLGGRRRLGLVVASVAGDGEEGDNQDEEQRAGVPHTHQTSVGPGVFPLVTAGAAVRL